MIELRNKLYICNSKTLLQQIYFSVLSIPLERQKDLCQIEDCGIFLRFMLRMLLRHILGKMMMILKAGDDLEFLPPGKIGGI